MRKQNKDWEEELLEANKSLSKDLVKARMEINRLWKFEERYKELIKKYEHLKRVLEIKQKVACVIVKKDGLNYTLRLTRVEDTPDGLFIEGEL